MENNFNQQYQQYWQNRSYNTPTQPSEPQNDLKTKDVGVCILLFFLTCGIYGLYWLYHATEDMKNLSCDTSATSGGRSLLFTILTGGLYGLYWFFRQGEIMEQLRVNYGLQHKYLAGCYLVLVLLGLAWISGALLQNEINRLIQLQ